MTGQLPPDIMEKAAKGISYIAHPLRLRILEFLDVNGKASVSEITRAVGEEQIIVSQHLKKLRDANLVKTERRGLFIYYQICEEYPASIFVCIRKLFGYMTDDFRFLADDYKAILPYDKMRILEYLTVFGPNNVSSITAAVGNSRLTVSQYLKRLRDDGFVTCQRKGRFIFYDITKGVHKTAIQCIHKRYDSLSNKKDF